MGQGGFLHRNSHVAIRVLTLVFAGFITWIIYQANMGFDNRVLGLVRSAPHIDKVLHFALFGGFAFVLSLALQKHTLRWGRWRFMLGAVFVAAFCLVEEFTQMGIATRSFDLLDLACDMAGIGIANWLAKRV